MSATRHECHAASDMLVSDARVSDARVSDALPVRVMVQDVWNEVQLVLPRSTSLAELKRHALRLARVARDPDAYVLKFRGAELRDESRALSEAGLVADAPLILLPRRRQPVR